MTKDNPSALKACPFCGGEPFFEHMDASGRWQISCSNEECLLAITWGSFARKAEAITAWNTRTSPPASEREAVLEEAAPNLCAAFRTTVSGGGEHTMVFRFPSLEALQSADREWHSLRSAK